MKQQTKYTLFLTFMTMLLVTSGLALAKKPPPKPSLIGTFQDDINDAVISDGNGPYSASWWSLSFLPEGGFMIETDERTVVMDLSDCVSTSCETCFDPETSGNTPIRMFIKAGPTWTLTEWTPGEYHYSEVSFTKKLSKKSYWRIKHYWDHGRTVVTTALDNIGNDGLVDTWVVTSASNATYDISFCEEVCTPMGSVNIPYSITFELE